MEKNSSLKEEYEKLASDFFELLNPYKGGEFVLTSIADPSHSSSKTASPMSAISVPLPRARGESASPPPRRGLFKSPQASPAVSAPPSPRATTESSTTSPRPKATSTEISSPMNRDSGHSQPASPRGASLANSAPQIGMKKATQGVGLKEKKGSVVELSNRSSNTLQSFASMRGARITSMPPSRERSRESSFNLEELSLAKNSDEFSDGPIELTVEKVFVPIKPGFAKRLVFNVAKSFDKKKAEESKKKGSGFNSRSITSHSTPVISTHSSPNLSRNSGVQKDFSYWNEIIPKSGLYLGVQPTKSNHPFLVDNPFYLNDARAKPYLLNPLIFPRVTDEPNKIYGCVFTFQEIYEMSGGLLTDNTFLDHNIFHSLGVTTRWLPFADNSGDVGEELALFRLYDMMNFYLQAVPIYLNCKSGKGRSAIFQILFLAFCFLLDKRVAINKDTLQNYIDIDDPTMDQAQYDQIWAVKRTRLFIVVEQITRYQKNNDLNILISSEEMPSQELLKLLLETCEIVVRKSRKIKPSTEQLNSALKILTRLTSCLYKEKHTAHPKCKSPNTAFIDDLTQSGVLRNIHIHMDGVTKNEDIACKSFQEFLMRLVYNKKGWYDELVYALSESQKAVEGECGYFFQVSDSDVRADRQAYLMLFKKEVDELLKKHAQSDYSKEFLALELSLQPSLSVKSPEFTKPQQIPAAGKSPRSLSLNSKALSPRDRSSFLSSKNPQDKKNDPPEEEVYRDKARTFGKATLPRPTLVGLLSPRLTSPLRSPKSSEDDSSEDVSVSSSDDNSDNHKSSFGGGSNV